MLLLLAGPPAAAQLTINSSPNVVGSGARALGMGGAFIGVADDATAASWNPGGLTQLERPELSLVYSYKWLNEEFNSSLHPEIDGNNSVDFNNINYFSFVYPIPRTIGGRNLVLSLNYQRKFDFDRDLDFQFRNIFALSGGLIVDSFFSKGEYSQRGALGAISPAFGFEVTDKLSLGMVMNLWDQALLPDNEWKARRTFRNVLRINGMLLPTSWTTLKIDEDFDNFEGTNYTFGLLYRATERFTVGAVYHTKFTADVDYSVRTTTRVSTAPFLGGTRAKRPQEYTFPSAFGIGLAYRFPNDKLTMSLDITRREWDQFVIDDPYNSIQGMRHRSGVTGIAKRLSTVDPTYTVRFGAEYVFVNQNKPKQNYLPSLRGGLFYDPEPAGGRGSFLGAMLTKGNGDPDDFFGLTLGAGVLIKDRVNLDAAYSYRWGKGARADTFSLANTDADASQHNFYVSTVIYFR